MNKNVIIIGVASLIVNLLLFFITISACDVAKENLNFNNANFFSNLSYIFFILFLFVSPAIIVVGALLKSETITKKEERKCPNCGRPIPMDSVICPYCRKDFSVK